LLKNQTHFNDYLQRSYNKHGVNKFEFTILESCDEGRLTEKEQAWVESKLGNIYNEVVDVTKMSGPSNPFFGHRHSELTRAKMSAAKKGKYVGSNNPNYGGKNRDVLVERMTGTRNSNSKLDDEKVSEIKTMLSCGSKNQEEIASLFNVSRTVITKIKNGNLWKHVKENE
jgi:group I intron endonuclease